MRRVLLVLACLASGNWASAAEPAGAISQMKGAATGTVEGAVAELDLGASVVMREVLATAAAARLEVTFLDATRLTLGESATVTIDTFVYDAGAASRIALAATGTLRFVSAIGKPANAVVTVSTPVAEIGVRGTDFWFGPIDGQFGVLLIEGAVSVSNTAGAVVLDQPGEGTNIAGPGAAPGPVTQWPQQKVERALAAVAF